MFSGKDLKVKLVYMGFGGLIAIIGMLFAIGMLSTVTAQSDKFETIQCSRLEVVDAEGTVRVTITTDEQGGVVTAHGKNGHSEASLRVEEDGGRVVAVGKDGQTRAFLFTDGHTGRVGTADKFGSFRIRR